MADSNSANGAASDATDNRTVEITGKDDRDDVFVDFDENDKKVSDLTQKVAALEKEKAELVSQNGDITQKIKNLREEMEGLERNKLEMKKEIERSEADKKALESVAARAAELETEVSRLQHDLISSMTEGEEANAALSELKRVVEELKKSDADKGSKVEVLEKERDLLLERVGKEAEEMKEMKIGFESRISDSEKKAAQIERLKKEKEMLEILKNEQEALLKKADINVADMEIKIVQLQMELEAKEKVISGLKGKAVEDGVNGKAVFVKDRGISEDGKKALKLQWPVAVAASTGAIAVVAVVYYLRSGRQR